MLKNWDIRFLNLAKNISLWSKDPSTKVGAVIVRSDKTIASVGYNGFPKNMPDNEEFYNERNEKYSRIIHAEMNALIHSKEDVNGMTLYTYPMMSCDRCFVHMSQAGIKRIVAPKIYGETYERWKESFNRVLKYAVECDMIVDLIDYN